MVIAASPEPMWIKDPYGRCLWSNGRDIPAAPLSEDEERVLHTGQSEVLTFWDGERDRQRLIFRASVQGLPVIVGYCVRF